MKGRFEFEEETLRQQATITLDPKPEIDKHGEEIPGKGAPEKLQVELRAVSIYQDSEQHQGGVVLKLESAQLASNIKAFAKSK